MKMYGMEARAERKRSIQAVNQGLGGLQDARVLGVEKSLVDKFDQSNSLYAKYDRIRRFISGLGTPLLEFIAIAGLMFVVLMMVAANVELKEMVPILGLFGAAIVRLRASVSMITQNASQLNYNMASVDAVVEDLRKLRTNLNGKIKHLQRNKEQSREILSFNKSIKIDGISYTYPTGEDPAVRNISLNISKGQSIGFVGATGSGKTTLIGILLGLLKPQKGIITIDGINMFNSLRKWQNNLGYISQSIYLLDDSIRNNIAFGLPEEEIDDAKLWKALRAAQLEEYVVSLQNGVETLVGERGIRLSGGQRQRIGLARALYHNPDVLLMDEATSALDNTTENKVMQAVEALKGDRTIIMIAHRLSTVKNCDCLYFLKYGRIEASGSYDDLINIHQDFRRMAQIG